MKGLKFIFGVTSGEGIFYGSAKRGEKRAKFQTANIVIFL